MFDCAPEAARKKAVNGLRPKDSASKMIHRDDRRRREKHPSIAIKGEERQGTEDVEMCFDPPAVDMDEQARHQHLGHGNRLTGHFPARIEPCKRDWQHREQ